MKKYSIYHLPVLDKCRKIIDLKLFKYFSKKNVNTTPIIIMAGGKGQRLSPLTDSCPKPMLKIGDKHILEIIIENCFRQGFRKFYLSKDSVFYNWYLADDLISTMNQAL